MVDQDSTAPDELLWQFCAEYYDRPGVANACLAIQDEFRGNVNILLFCVWQGERGQALERAHFSMLEGGIADWHTIVTAPLRKIRRELKLAPVRDRYPDSDIIRERVLAVELQAERTEQRLLLAALDGKLSAEGVVASCWEHNVRGYLAYLDVPTHRQEAVCNVFERAR